MPLKVSGESSQHGTDIEIVTPGTTGRRTTDPLAQAGALFFSAGILTSSWTAVQFFGQMLSDYLLSLGAAILLLRRGWMPRRAAPSLAFLPISGLLLANLVGLSSKAILSPTTEFAHARG